MFFPEKHMPNIIIKKNAISKFLVKMRHNSVIKETHMLNYRNKNKFKLILKTYEENIPSPKIVAY